MVYIPSDHSLLSTAYMALVFTAVLVGLAATFALAMALPLTAFHTGRWLLGEHLDVGHPGQLIAGFLGFFYYCGLCGLAPNDSNKLRFIMLNVPFGVGVVTGVVLGLFALGVGIGRVTGLIGGGSVDVNDDKREE